MVKSDQGASRCRNEEALDCLVSFVPGMVET